MNILITGGTGSLGSELVKVFTTQGHAVTVLSRDPHKQAKLLAEYPQVNAILGDVRDYTRVLFAMQGQQKVVHAAANKRVDLGETNPEEYFSVNVEGTQNVARAAIACGVRQALLIATDKACCATTLYGVTKHLATGVWLSKLNSGVEFCALRYGNVVNSNGSVWQVWQERVAGGLPLVVREPEPTRFFMCKTEAVALVLNVLLHIRNGGIFVPGNTPAFSLWDLARELQPESRWCRELLGPGEKQHEVLVAPTEYIEQITEDLWCIDPKRAKAVHSIPAQFYSETAPRLDAKEVIRRLHATDHC